MGEIRRQRDVPVVGIAVDIVQWAVHMGDPDLWAGDFSGPVLVLLSVPGVQCEEGPEDIPKDWIGDSASFYAVGGDF